jgi:hypothetical protein
MTREEALAILDVSADATAEEVEIAFKAAIKSAHPDTASNGGSQRVDRLVQARSVLQKADSTDLVPLSTVAGLVESLNSMAFAPQREAHADRAVKHVVMHHVGRLASVRRSRTALAVTSGGIAAVVTILQATTKFGVSGSVNEETQATALITAAIGALILIAAGVGLLAWRAGGEEKILKLELEGAAETLSDKATIFETLSEIAAAGGLALESGWTRQTLIDAISAWCADDGGATEERPRPRAIFRSRVPEAVPFHVIARTIGAVDFARLITAKGLEQQIVKEARVADSQHGYTLAV